MKFVSISMMVLSVIYLMTRIQCYYELQDYRHTNRKAMIGTLSAKYDNIELLHILTIAHSITCVCISTFVYMLMRKDSAIDRR